MFAAAREIGRNLHFIQGAETSVSFLSSQIPMFNKIFHTFWRVDEINQLQSEHLVELRTSSYG